MNHIGTKNLETKRLLLRKIADNDILSYSDSEGQRTHMSEMIKEYNKPNFYYWLIAEKSSNESVGLMRTIDDDDDLLLCDMAYEIKENFRNKGYASEALKAVLEFLLIEVGFNRIGAGHLADNPASGRVMEKAGMKYEGTSRQNIRNSEGILTDTKSYGILREDLL